MGEVTHSQAHSLYSLEHGAAGKASEADSKPVTLSEFNQGLQMLLLT
jgi:hypothetical protein